LDFDADVWTQHYDVISNETLWFLHHGLFDPPRTPVFDDRWWEAWAAFDRVNQAFATDIAQVAPDGAVVLVQDYHLALVGSKLRLMRPDLRSVHFHHTPFAGPDELALLPGEAARTLMEGLAGFDTCGFHTAAWADRFQRSAASIGCAEPAAFVTPLGVDVDSLAVEAASPACEAELARLDELVGDRQLVVRVDRIELSKNLLRGFDAFSLLLEREPHRRGSVIFGAFCYPSRQGVPAYATYRDDIVATVERINQRWATPDWTPIVLEMGDDFARSLAALRRSDLLVVNPVRDGMNLVAKEGAVVNERHGGLVLSRTAGAWDELGQWSEGVNPFDVSETASALAAGLDRSAGERAELAARRAEVVGRRSPRDWLDDQLGSIGVTAPGS
jgi:trehalose 6-phosphate synthase